MKTHAENVRQKLIPDPSLILINNPKQYVLVCHPCVTLMYSYVLACHPYVTRIYSYVIRMSLVCGFIMNQKLLRNIFVGKI